MKNPNSKDGKADSLPPKELTTDIAQRLYGYYTAMGLDPREWIACLQGTLEDSTNGSENSGTGGARDSANKIDDPETKESREDGGPGNIGRKVKSIITHDKGIYLDGLDEYGRNALVREVTEWLAAEQIGEKMLKHRTEVERGIESGMLCPIAEVLEVVIRKDDEFFQYPEGEKPAVDIKEFIRLNYVVKIGGRPMGEGTRACVRELVPVEFPFPIPKRDELREGLMLKYPNNYLVIRLMRDVHKKRLGVTVNESEKQNVTSLMQAADSLTFTEKTEPDSETIAEEQRTLMSNALQNEALLRDKLVHRDNGQAVYSFIPPLIVLIIKLRENDEPVYATIQKKISGRGGLFDEKGALDTDLKQIPGFREKAQNFVSACKDFYQREKKLPDISGPNNVLYTDKGNIYLVDINNIAEEPDYKMLSLTIMLKKLTDDHRSAFSSREKPTITADMKRVKEEIAAHVAGAPHLKDFSGAQAEKVSNQIYNYDERKDARDFLKQIRFFDDISFPVFLANIIKMSNLEKRLLKSSFESGEITAEELSNKIAELGSDPFYSILNPHRGFKMNSRFSYVDDAVADLKAGGEKWIMFYAYSFLDFYVKWTEGSYEFGR